MANSNKIILKSIDEDKFVDFIKKFLTFDSNLLLEIEEENGENFFSVKSFTPSKTSIKYGRIAISDCFDIDEEVDLPLNLKIGIYGVRNLATYFGYIEDSEFELIIHYPNEASVDDNLWASNIELNSTSLKKNFAAAKRNSFKLMPKEAIPVVFNTEDSNWNFRLSSNDIKKIKTLMELEASTIISINVIDDKNVVFGTVEEDGVRINIETADIEINNNVNIEINKENFKKYLDDDSCSLYCKDNSLLFLEGDDPDTANIKVALSKVKHEETEL